MTTWRPVPDGITVSLSALHDRLQGRVGFVESVKWKKVQWTERVFAGDDRAARYVLMCCHGHSKESRATRPHAAHMHSMRAHPSDNVHEELHGALVSHASREPAGAEAAVKTLARSGACIRDIAGNSPPMHDWDDISHSHLRHGR